MSYLDDLEKLSRLRQSGALTEEEFQDRKAQLVDKPEQTKARIFIIGTVVFVVFGLFLLSLKSSPTKNNDTATITQPKQEREETENHSPVQATAAPDIPARTKPTDAVSDASRVNQNDQSLDSNDLECTGTWKVNTSIFDHITIDKNLKITLFKDHMVVLEGESFSQNAVDGLWGLDDTAGQYTIFYCSQRTATAKVGVSINNKETIFPAVKDDRYFD